MFVIVEVTIGSKPWYEFIIAWQIVVTLVNAIQKLLIQILQIILWEIKKWITTRDLAFPENIYSISMQIDFGL